MLENGHLTEETIDRLIREALLPEELEPVEEHLEQCLMCRSRVRSCFRGMEVGDPLSLSGPPPGWRPRDVLDKGGQTAPAHSATPWLLIIAVSLGAMLGVAFAAAMAEFVL